VTPARSQLLPKSEAAQTLLDLYLDGEGFAMTCNMLRIFLISIAYEIADE